jgi:hypothetical protein
MRQGAKVVAEVRRIVGSRQPPSQTARNGRGAKSESEFITKLRRDAERERALSEGRADGGLAEVLPCVRACRRGRQDPARSPEDGRRQVINLTKKAF